MKAPPVSMVTSPHARHGLVLAFVAATAFGAAACDSGVCQPTGKGGAGGSAGGGAGAGGLGGMSSAGGDICSPVGPFAMTGCPEVSGAPLGVESHPQEGFTHLVICSATCYGTNPPSSGNHYPVWADYKTYSDPVPWGFLVHVLEHGGIVVSYNCPCGCLDEVAKAQAWIDSLPVDPACHGPSRIVLAPDLTLDVPWAASAWTWTLRSGTFDAEAFQTFYSDHYNHGLELNCDRGTDGSASGWCQ